MTGRLLIDIAVFRARRQGVSISWRKQANKLQKVAFDLIPNSSDIQFIFDDVRDDSEF